MNISPISNQSFRSKLPPEVYTRDGATQDCWKKFADLTEKNKDEFALKNILERISKEGKYNILALESTDSSKPFVDYHFRYYNTYKDLEYDRVNNPNQGEKNIGKSITIRENKLDKRVYEVNTKTGEVVQKFKSLFEALSRSLLEMLKVEKTDRVRKLTTSELLKIYRGKI